MVRLLSGQIHHLHINLLILNLYSKNIQSVMQLSTLVATRNSVKSKMVLYL